LFGKDTFKLKKGVVKMSRNLGIQTTEFCDYEVRLSESRLDAQQLRSFVDAQMPRTGIGEVPWSTPLSSEQLTELAGTGKAEFVTAHMMLAADGEPPLIGIGALIRDPDNYKTPRMIIVVESDSRGQGFGKRIANELLRRLNPGETVQAEVQQELTIQGRRANFFKKLGFKCVEERHRSGDVSEFVAGAFVGTVQKYFDLYALSKDAED